MSDDLRHYPICPLCEQSVDPDGEDVTPFEDESGRDAAHNRCLVIAVLHLKVARERRLR
jgi:hypothetical protein